MYTRSQPAPTNEDQLPRSQPLVVTLGLAQPLHGEFEAFRIFPASDANDALRALSDEDVAVLVLGSRLTAITAVDFLADCVSRLPWVPPAIVLCAGLDPEIFQALVDEGPIFYLARGELEARQLFSLIRASVNQVAANNQSRQSLLSERMPASDCLLDLCVRLPMQTDLRSCGGLITKTAHEVIGASNAMCLVYDSKEDTLTPAETLDQPDVKYTAASGLIAFVARTGEGIRLENIEADFRYDPDVDNLHNSSDARFIAEPILGSEGSPITVIAAARSAESPAFLAQDSLTLKYIAECAAPTISQILMQTRMQAQLTERVASADGNSDIFRPEALEYHIRNWDRQGDVLKTLPVWLRRTYWIVLVMALIGMVGLALFIPGLRDIFGKAN